MPKGRDIDTLLKPLSRCPMQCYPGRGLHTLGLLGWITGIHRAERADALCHQYTINGMIYPT